MVELPFVLYVNISLPGVFTCCRPYGIFLTGCGFIFSRNCFMGKV